MAGMTFLRNYRNEPMNTGRQPLVCRKQDTPHSGRQTYDGSRGNAAGSNGMRSGKVQPIVVTAELAGFC